jgi:carbonic anhydrase/acetyltransferase-like protein (isoleucine patch superfamily)
VSGNARVYGDAQVSGDARVYGDAWVSGNARVYGDAQVSGDAWVSGNARVYGNAWVYGDAQVYGNACRTPINIIGLDYPVTIADCSIMIGCEHHKISEWREFDDRRILAMDGKRAATFWKAHKATILGICDATERPFA